MLHNQLTPPYDDSTTGTSFEMENGVRVGSEHPTAIPTQANNLVASPLSALSTDPDEVEERSYMEGLVTADSTDDDQDMSDGGADLAMAFSHHPDTHQLDTEMHQLGADITGPDTQYPTNTLQHPTITLNDGGHPESYQSSPQYNEEPLEAIPVPTMGGSLNVPGAPGNSNLPATMSEVSQQLQHLQDGLDIVEVDMPVEQQAGFFANNSTPPIPLSYTAHFLSLVLSSFPESVSVAETPDLAAPSPPLGSSHNEPQSHNELQPIGGEGIAQSDPATTAGSVEPIDPWPDADHHEVEDHLNLSSGDFLYQWHTDAVRRPEQYNKRRGPNLTSIIKHRNNAHEPVPPVRRCDLRGEECDFQRINWAELGVLRREAKIVRSRFYHNYTNLSSRHLPFVCIPNFYAKLLC